MKIIFFQMNFILLTDGHPAPPLIEEPVEDSAPPPPPLPNSDFGKYQTSTLILLESGSWTPKKDCGSC